jgi:hypothetical protein
MYFKKPDAPTCFRLVEKKIRRELGELVRGELTHSFESLENPPPMDDRSWFRKFVDSSELFGASHRLRVDIPVEDRTLYLVVDIGKPEGARYWLCMVLHMAIHSRRSLGYSAFEPKRKAFEGDHAVLLNSDKTLRKLLRSLVRYGYHAGSHNIGGIHASLCIQPEENGSSFLLDTAPQETWGGFVLRLGLGEFLTAAEKIERLADQAGSFHTRQNPEGADLRARLDISATEAAAGCEKELSFQRLVRHSDGNGSVTETKKVTILVPAGVQPGTVLRLRGMGNELAHDGPAGDLYVEINIVT